MFAPVLNPLYRAIEQHGGNRDRHVFWIKHQLGTKAPADIRRDHPHLVFITPQQRGEHAHRGMRRLCRTPYRKPVLGGVMHGHDTPAFNGMAPAAVLP